jgi:hypothetical protein
MPISLTHFTIDPLRIIIYYNTAGRYFNKLYNLCTYAYVDGNGCSEVERERERESNTSSYLRVRIVLRGKDGQNTFVNYLSVCCVILTYGK